MRLTTVFLVSALLILAAAVYAEDCDTTAPVGSGPTTETTTTTTTVMTPTPPGATGTTMAMTPEVEELNTNLVTLEFGMDRSSIANLRQAGWTWGDINMLASLSNRTGQPIMSVAQLRSQGTSWADIATRWNVASADLTTPNVVRTRVAGFTTEYGYEPLYYRTDVFGNPVLTRWDYSILRKQGYTWQNIAIASNIAAATGVSVKELLAQSDRGETWPMIARSYGLNPKDVMDVDRFPFSGESGMMSSTTTTTTTTTTRHRRVRERTETETTPSGAGPMEPSMTPSPPPSTY